MNEPLDFNPYYKWLSVPKNILRPNYYQLLGLAMFETNAEIIAMAGKVALMKLDRIPLDDPHADLVPRLQALIEFATDTLCDPEKHREYDQRLKQKIADYMNRKKAAVGTNARAGQGTNTQGASMATPATAQTPLAMPPVPPPAEGATALGNGAGQTAASDDDAPLQFDFSEDDEDFQHAVSEDSDEAAAGGAFYPSVNPSNAGNFDLNFGASSSPARSRKVSEPLPPLAFPLKMPGAEPPQVFGEPTGQTNLAQGTNGATPPMPPLPPVPPPPPPGMSGGMSNGLPGRVPPQVTFNTAPPPIAGTPAPAPAPAAEAPAEPKAKKSLFQRLAFWKKSSKPKEKPAPQDTAGGERTLPPVPPQAPWNVPSSEEPLRMPPQVPQESAQGDAWRWPAGVDRNSGDNRVPPTAASVYLGNKGNATGANSGSAQEDDEEETASTLSRSYKQVICGVSALLFLILLLAVYHFFGNQNEAEDHFLAAQKAFKEEIYDKANREITKAIELAPFSNDEYKEFQQEIEEKQKQTEERHRKRAEAKSHADKADDFCKRNQWDEAQQEIAKALELFPGNEDFLKMKKRIEDSAFAYQLKKQNGQEGEAEAATAAQADKGNNEPPISEKPAVEESLAEIDPTIKAPASKEEAKPEGDAKPNAEAQAKDASKPEGDVKPDASAQAQAPKSEGAAQPEATPAPEKPVVKYFKEEPSEHKAGEEFKRMVHGVPYVFRWCPPGTFMMGSPADEPGRDMGDRELQHLVTLTKGFWMLETEVTQQMWEDIMKENPSANKGSKNPVEKVSWNECQKFCQELSKAADDFKVYLPTESQWEYACRAGTESTFAVPCSDSAWYRDNSENKSHEVAQKTPNPWGLYDMHGNVCEWCESWFENYPTAPVKDPKGFATGTTSNRIRRGGAYNSVDSTCRSASRQYGTENQKQATVGFRIIALPK